MTTEFTSRVAIDPSAAAMMGTDELRHPFLADRLMIVGEAMPSNKVAKAGVTPAPFPIQLCCGRQL